MIASVAFRWYFHLHLHLTAIVIDLFSSVQLISPKLYVSLSLISKAFLAEESTTTWSGSPWLDSPDSSSPPPGSSSVPPLCLAGSKGPRGIHCECMSLGPWLRLCLTTSAKYRQSPDSTVNKSFSDVGLWYDIRSHK